MGIKRRVAFQISGVRILLSYQAKLSLFLILFIFFQSNIFSQIQLTDSTVENKNYNISLIMPFCSKQILENPNHKNAELGNSCREYYQGLLLAADTLTKSGMKLTLSVFDTEKDSSKFLHILKKDIVQNADLIFGPANKDAQLSIIKFAAEKNKFHISPLFTFTKTKIEDPFLISANPDFSFYADFLVSRLNNSVGECNLIVISGKSSSSKIFADRMKILIKPESGIKLKVLEFSKHADVKKYYSTTRPNQIVVTCDEEYMIDATLKSIIDTLGEYDITTFGLRSWLDFKTINPEKWESANINIITPYFVDYAQKIVSEFVEKYRSKYNTEPSEYAICGYEQFLFFMKGLENTKGNLHLLENQKAQRLLSNQYLIKKKFDGQGLQNTSLHLLKWKENKLAEAK